MSEMRGFFPFVSLRVRMTPASVALRCDAKHVEGFVYRAGYEQHFAVLRLEHAFGDAVIEEVEQAVVEAVGVEEKDGFLMQAERVPGEDLEELLEGAEASGKRDEGVSVLADEGLAGVHGVGDVQLGDAAVGDFEIDEHLWNNADDFTASGKRGFCDGAHEADLRASVDDADVSFGERAAKSFGSHAVDGVGTVSGSAEDGYVLNHVRRGYQDAAQCGDRLLAEHECGLGGRSRRICSTTGRCLRKASARAQIT